ncbi:MAG: HD domain-containing protein [Alphaproteobacteria bacterium]|nr:HD domain-containing protein [Alphaproteobacteria bacterium]
MGKVREILCGDDSCQELKKLKTEVNSFVNNELETYNKKVCHYCQQHTISADNIKNFYDAVWGTITVSEGEKLILDSPILQRLRNIKQLGLADLLYSSANHTRFSHTLGVLFTASSMWQQIERELTKNHVPFDKDVETTIRLAALFHDCGHMFCSHASERFFQNDASYTRQKDIQKIRNFFNKKLNIKPGLSEILSCLIVFSPHVGALLNGVQHGLKDLKLTNDNALNDLAEKISCLILGLPYSLQTVPYSQIISGQIDSDKLDYLKRDSYATGVPVAIDMSRVFQKLRIVKTDKHYEMISNPSSPLTTTYRLGIAPAAINTVDHLVISRYMMFENIYFHQKVLTAEETLRYALRKISKCSTGILDDFSTVLCISDAQIISEHFYDIVKNLPGRMVNDENEFKDALRILKDVSKRVLFKRCISFTTNNITFVGETETNFYTDIFVDQKEKEQELFIEKVTEEVKRIKSLLNGIYSYNENTDIILIVTPPISTISLNSNMAIADKKNHDRNMEFESDSWLKSRTSQKAYNYLASYEEDRHIVFIAAEKVLYQYYGSLLNDTVLYDDNDERLIDNLKKDLDKKQYFSDAYPLLPDDDILRFRGDLETLVDKWQGYERFSPTKATTQRINLTTIVSYIKQFSRFKEKLGDYDVFVKGCIELLKNVLIISKKEIIKSLTNNIKEVQKLSKVDFSEIQICSLGTLQDSGSQIAYHLNEVNDILKRQLTEDFGVVYKVKSLNELQEGDIKPVMLFIEDAFSSGKQITSIFEELMGVDASKRQTQESHGRELPDDIKNKLKQSKLYFSFIFYDKQNEKDFIERLKELGLTDVHLIQYKDFPESYFKRADVQNRADYQLTKSYFEKAAELLLHDKAIDEEGNYRANWNEERLKSSLLGYNDAQKLIVFPWNTPTYTITALWLSSRKENWFSLFQRIAK